ncbi:unnamed protein product [marine sediment metagenome]|uniref:CEP76/DRC7 peptidase-like domain-containing protein n=1 Tax=marine sediment metagenome TaxID=412755 RepID=X1Q1P5_9ZZZZ
MITAEEWDRLLERLAPVISIGIGGLSLVLGTMALMRAGPFGRRIYSQDGRYLVSVRYPGQWRDLREFVQPDNPDVLAVYSQIGPDPWSLYNFVCQNVQYVADIGEFWKSPSEVLASGTGDCEDSTNLLTSLLRCGGLNAYTALGEYQGYGHAWTVQNGFIYETTYTSARLVPDLEDYCPYILFDEKQIIELWPGALGEVFELGRNEATKLNLMAEALRCLPEFGKR